MTRPETNLSRSRRAAAAVAVLALGGAATAVFAAPPQTLYYERVLMDAAGGRCDLFAPKVRLSLLAGAAQARSAAAAAGTPPSALDATAARAQAKADAVTCDSPELRIAAQRVRAAFLVWSHEPELVLPGHRGLWRARRWKPHLGPMWALVERSSLAGAPVALGLVIGARPDEPLEVAAVTSPGLADGAYAARLVVRDPARAPEPYLTHDAGPPPGATRTFLARAREPADARLLAGGGVLFRFPSGVIDALLALDGRESVRLELVHSAPRGERVVSVLFEVGDVATGRAFLAAGT